MTFYTPLKRKFDFDHFLLGVKNIYETEAMKSYRDIIANRFRKLFPLMHQFERKFDQIMIF